MNSPTSRILGVIVFIVTVLSVDSCGAQRTGQKLDFSKARREMIATQIEARGVADERVLAAMEKVERHLFVPDGTRSLAYADQPLPIGEGQTISQPYIVALMTELAQIDSSETVLEIGTGSGYQAAILGELCREVYSIEIVQPLADRAAKTLTELGYKNITVRHGDGYAGWPEHAPFDAVIVTCAPPTIPQPLIDQLADGGRLVSPVGTFWQELILIEKCGGLLTETSVIPVRFVPMTGPGVREKR
ncbi:MAG TPA: protein-L-isoaspartate(D-aspartate) O-methyltransferase [Candidatus Deferrimicrobium sp.]|nr:protein-L-isoaspartate(D-aspartate) O-methyltransferase [Candidatus Deferrimicrobium sp.]